MPEVGGGPSTSILTLGSDLSMSDQVLLGLATSLPSLSGTCVGQRQEHLLHRELQGRAGLGLGDRQAVEADLDLDDVLDAVLLAVLELALLDGARGIGDVGMGLADAGAEQLHAAAGAGRFDDRASCRRPTCRTARRPRS